MFQVKHLYSRLPIVAIVTILLIGQGASSRGGQSVLTGRWGETLMPAQLVFNYPTRQCKALVVVTFSTKCPLARRLVPDLNALQRKYADAGIQFIGLFPNGVDDIAGIAKYALDTDLMFPVYKDDPENPWHEQLQLKTTPHAIVLDTRDGYAEAKTVYRGQVNKMWFGGGTSDSKQNYLADALESFLENKPVALAETAASGCAIAKESYRDLRPYADVNYYREISRLLQDNCAECHRPGEPGATLFSAFDDYETAASMSGVMLSRVENRLMPPWQGVMEEDNEWGGFQHDPRLTDEEIDMFRAWVKNGCPAGDPEDAPEPKQWPDSEDWRIGRPDFVFKMPEPYIVPKFRLDEYQYYCIDANFPEDRFIQAIETRPGNKAVVHHIGAIVGPHSNKQLKATQAMLELYGLTGDRVKKIGDYVAGDPFNARVYPDGYALKLPAGHDIFFEVHYTPTGKEEEADVSELGIRWAKEKPAHVLETKVFNRKDLRLRPLDMHYEKANYYQFATDVLIHALAPHMHFRGKDFAIYKAEDPGAPNEQRTLIMKVPAYDFNWQRTYEFVKPVELRAGDALYCVTHFDNSHYNPNNPDPEALVRYGLLSEQEMLNLRVKYEEVNLDEL